MTADLDRDKSCRTPYAAACRYAAHMQRNTASKIANVRKSTSKGLGLVHAPASGIRTGMAAACPRRSNRTRPEKEGLQYGIGLDEIRRELVIGAGDCGHGDRGLRRFWERRFRKYSVSRRRPVYSPNTRRVCSIRISSAVPLAALRVGFESLEARAIRRTSSMTDADVRSRWQPRSLLPAVDCARSTRRTAQRPNAVG